jgi:hypothetical protein
LEEVEVADDESVTLDAVVDFRDRGELGYSIVS